MIGAGRECCFSCWERACLHTAPALASATPLPPQLYPLPQRSTEPEEEALLARRQALHRLLGLPTNRPLLRVANAADWSAGGAAGAAGGLAAALAAGGVGGKPRLSDVHLGLPASPVGGSVHLVQGSYDYYHYMQVGSRAELVAEGGGEGRQSEGAGNGTLWLLRMPGSMWLPRGLLHDALPRWVSCCMLWPT